MVHNFNVKNKREIEEKRVKGLTEEEKEEFDKKEAHFKKIRKYYQKDRLIRDIQKKMKREKRGKTKKEGKEENTEPKNPLWMKADARVQEVIYNARVPIIKLRHYPMALPVDISVNQGSNVVSKLMMMFVKYDERVRPFLCALKYWAHKRKICKAIKGFLNMFGWMLVA